MAYNDITRRLRWLAGVAGFLFAVCFACLLLQWTETKFFLIFLIIFFVVLCVFLVYSAVAVLWRVASMLKKIAEALGAAARKLPGALPSGSSSQARADDEPVTMAAAGDGAGGEVEYAIPGAGVIDESFASMVAAAQDAPRPVPQADKEYTPVEAPVAVSQPVFIGDFFVGRPPVQEVKEPPQVPVSMEEMLARSVGGSAEQEDPELVYAGQGGGLESCPSDEVEVMPRVGGGRYVMHPADPAVFDSLAAFVAASKSYGADAGRFGRYYPGHDTLDTLEKAWVPAGKTVKIKGLIIPGGMFFVGVPEKRATIAPAGFSVCGQPDIIINPKLAVDTRQDGSVAETDAWYWPVYEALTKTDRLSFLTWMATGKNNPDAALTYPFLYFYGLEARASMPFDSHETVVSECSEISKEVTRLLSIYGANPSFSGYANTLLAYLSLRIHADKKYYHLDPFGFGRNVSEQEISVAVSQALVDGERLPARWALAWALFDRGISKRTAWQRCGALSHRLFLLVFDDVYPNGFKISSLSTAIKLEWHAAGRTSLSGWAFVPYNNDFIVPRGETLYGAYSSGRNTGRIEGVVNEVSKVLAAYSRYIGKYPDAAASLDAMFFLEKRYRDEETSLGIEAVFNVAASKNNSLSWADFLVMLRVPEGTEFDLARCKALGAAMAKEGILQVPPLAKCSTVPSPSDVMSLYLDGAVIVGSAPEAVKIESPAFRSASATVLGCLCLLAVDGFTDEKLVFIRDAISRWDGLSAAHKMILESHVNRHAAEPSFDRLHSEAMAQLKKIPVSMTAPIAAFLADVAQYGGSVSNTDIALLEKLYKALRVDKSVMFSNLHIAATGGVGAHKTSSGFSLDAARIEELHKETEQVAGILSSIFTESDEQLTAPTEDTAEPVAALPGDGGESMVTLIPGVGGAVDIFARRMIERSSWSKADINALATELGIMAIGSIERINDACFDLCGGPLIEGDGPYEVNAETIQLLTEIPE